MASVLPAGVDLPSEVLFPNQTIPVLPENHWATDSGEIWVPVDKSESVTSQLVFAVYSNLDVLFGADVETSFFHVDIEGWGYYLKIIILEKLFKRLLIKFLNFNLEKDDNFDSDVDISESEISTNVSEATTEPTRTTCLQLDNGTERCTSDDDTKPHLTLNSLVNAKSIASKLISGE